MSSTRRSVAPGRRPPPTCACNCCAAGRMMRGVLLRASTLLLLALLCGCASTPPLVPGRSTEADVQASMGTPTETRVLADGSRVLWYMQPIPDAAFGSERVAATIAPDGTLRSVEQRLVPEYIKRVIPGQSK